MDRSAPGIARSIRLAREGSAEALNDLIEGHRNYLRVLATSCLHRDLRSKADASDVVQETLLKVHRGFDRFEGATEQEWMAWLRKILLRTMTDLQRSYLRRRRAVERERPLGSLLERSSSNLVGLVPSDGTSPSQNAHRREMAALVADALAELEPDALEAVTLRSLHELDWDTIAERMGRSPDAARMVWARALRRVGGLLRERVS